MMITCPNCGGQANAPCSHCPWCHSPIPEEPPPAYVPEEPGWRAFLTGEPGHPPPVRDEPAGMGA